MKNNTTPQSTISEKSIVNPLKIDWEFIEKWYPHYHYSPDVLECDILQRYLDDEPLQLSDLEYVNQLTDNMTKDCDMYKEYVLQHLNSISMDLLNSATKYYIKHKAEKSKVVPQVDKFTVNLVRVGYAFTSVDIEATSEEEARVKALDMAGDLEYSEKDAEYKLEDF